MPEGCRSMGTLVFERHRFPCRNRREVPPLPLCSGIAAVPHPADAPPSSLCDTRPTVSDGFLPPLPPPSPAVPDKMRDRSDAAPAICAHTLASSSSSRRSDAIPVICHSPQSPTGSVRFQDMEQSTSIPALSDRSRVRLPITRYRKSSCPFSLSAIYRLGTER